MTTVGSKHPIHITFLRSSGSGLSRKVHPEERPKADAGERVAMVATLRKSNTSPKRSQNGGRTHSKAPRVRNSQIESRKAGSGAKSAEDRE